MMTYRIGTGLIERPRFEVSEDCHGRVFSVLDLDVDIFCGIVARDVTGVTFQTWCGETFRIPPHCGTGDRVLFGRSEYQASAVQLV